MSKILQNSTDIKIVILGNSGVGKTSFVKQWTKGNFNEEYKATIMSEFSYKIFEYKGKYYKIQFWDIGGQDKNIYTSKVFTKNAYGCILLSDITNEDTLNVTIRWKNSIDENSRFVDGDYLPSLLVQNKVDLITDENLKEPTEKVKKFASENGYLTVLNASAKTGEGVDIAMDYLIKTIIDRLEEYSKKTNKPINNDNRTSIVIEQPKKSNESLLKMNKCCNYI
jgi:small GTP-binding protein